MPGRDTRQHPDRPRLKNQHKELPVLIIAAATAEEIRETRKATALQNRWRHAGMQFFSGRLAGRDILLIQTGVGPKKAGAAANKIIKDHAPQAVIAIGAAGAADPGLLVGDIVIARTMLHHSGERFPADEAWSGKITAQLKALGMPVSRGDCYTAKTFIHTAGQKQHIFQTTGARVLDMESASLARRLHPAGIAVVNIRIISDTAGKDAFNIEAFYGQTKKNGRFGACSYFLKNPGELLRAVRLKKNVRQVGKRIAAVLANIVQES